MNIYKHINAILRQKIKKILIVGMNKKLYKPNKVSNIF